MGALPPPAMTGVSEQAFSRLERALAYADGFAMYFLVCVSPGLRGQLIARLTQLLAQRGSTLAQVELPPGCQDPLQEVLARVPNGAQAVSVVGLPECGDGAEGFAAVARRMNLQRERWAHVLPLPVLLWMDHETVETLSEAAPDFTAWTRGVEEFRVAVLWEGSRAAEAMAMLSMLGDSTGARRPVTPERLQALQGLLADLRAAEPTPQSREALFRVARDVQWALLDRGSSDDAIALGEEMAQLADEAGDAQWRLRFGNDLGKAYAGSGDGHRPDSSRVAEVQFTKVLAGARDMGDRRAESAALNNLGIVFQMRGGVREALSLYRQALAIAREVRDRRSEGPVLANLGLAHASLGDVGQAIECYEQALAISREIGDYRGECSALGNLGVAYASLGDLRRAADLVQDALRLALAARDPLRTPQHASQLADVRRDRGDLAAAVALQGLALSRFSALGDPEAGRAARELARYRDRMGEEAFSAALAGAEDVVAGIFRELAGPEGEAMARPLQVTPDDVDAALAAGWGRATAPRRCSATPVANTHHVICPDHPHPASAKEALPCSSHCFFRTTMSRLLLRLL